MLSTKASQTSRVTYLKNYQVPAYFIHEIKLTFELNDAGTRVSACMRLMRNRASQDKSHELLLNGESMQLESIAINGTLLDQTQYEVDDTSLLIHQVPDHFDLSITVMIHPENNTALSGLYCSRGTYCTQCEAQGFRRIIYYLDQPDILSRFTTTIIADAKRYPYLLSNGNLIDSGKLADGRHWVTWEDPFKKPSYLFALVAGDFDLIEDQFITQSKREVALRIYVEKGLGDFAHHALYCLKEAMRWDEQAYGREYDLDIYMIVAINDFNMGAMENKGLNIFNTKYILAKPETATDDDYIDILSVIGHEYFHNWSGNRVTCRDWFQLSLKEGLTIFRDQSFTEEVLSRAVMRIRDVTYLRDAQFPEDAGPLAHPVRPESYIEINNFYTSTIYNKGAEILRMLQTILGNVLFRKGMDLYFTSHDGQAVTIEDFVQAMEAVSGVDLQQFRLWYQQAGTPVVTVKDEYDAAQKIYRLHLQQMTPSTPGQPEKAALFIPIKINLLNDAGAEILAESVLNLTKIQQTFVFENIPFKPTPSLLRHFSAPIKLNYPYSDEQLQLLFKHDQDAFSRFEAGQQLALRVILDNVLACQKGLPLKIQPDFIALYEYLLQQDWRDSLLLAEMLLLPSEKYIGEQMTVIDVDAIHVAREFVWQTLADKLAPLMLKIYRAQESDLTKLEFDINIIGKRQLKNRCLSYLARLPDYVDLAIKQFDGALQFNMTDTQSALIALVNSQSSYKEEALSQFYRAFQHDALVIDKWLAIQAASKLPGTLQRVKQLLTHEAFDIKNPNKVFALIGTFASRNPVHFHAKSGEGYVFLRETIQQLDKLNPQIAARMVHPLTGFRRYDKERQALMHQQLAILLSDKTLSRDLYELVSKSLE